MWRTTVLLCQSTIATEAKTAATTDNWVIMGSDSIAMDKEVQLESSTREYRQMQLFTEELWSKIKVNKDKYQRIKCPKQELDLTTREPIIRNSEVQMGRLVHRKLGARKTCWNNQATVDNIQQTSNQLIHFNNHKTSWEIHSRWCTSKNNKSWTSMKNVVATPKDQSCFMVWVDKEDLKILVFLFKI